MFDKDCAMVATAAVLARRRGLEISTTETHPGPVSIEGILSGT
jgi:hypothetical protein